MRRSSSLGHSSFITGEHERRCLGWAVPNVGSFCRLGSCRMAWITREISCTFLCYLVALESTNPGSVETCSLWSFPGICCWSFVPLEITQFTRRSGIRSYILFSNCCNLWNVVECEWEELVCFISIKLQWSGRKNEWNVSVNLMTYLYPWLDNCTNYTLSLLYKGLSYKGVSYSYRVYSVI